MRRNDALTHLQMERIRLKAELKVTENRLATNLQFVKENAVWLLVKGVVNSPKMQESVKRELSNFALGFVQGIIPGWLFAEGGGTAKKWAAKAFSWVKDKFDSGQQESEEKEKM